MGPYESLVPLLCPLVPSNRAGQEVLLPLPSLITTSLKCEQKQHCEHLLCQIWNNTGKIGSKPVRSVVGGGQAGTGEYPALLGTSASVCVDEHFVPLLVEHSKAIPKHSPPTPQTLCDPEHP